jgi:hypothetical protein
MLTWQTGDIYKLSLPISPTVKIPHASPTDTGKAVVAILNHPKETLAKSVFLEGEYISLNTMLEQWAAGVYGLLVLADLQFAAREQSSSKSHLRLTRPPS